MTSPNQPYTAPSNPEPYDTFYNPLATPIPNYDPHSIFCPEGYAEGWSQACLNKTTTKVKAAAKRKLSETPPPLSPLPPFLSPLSPLSPNQPVVSPVPSTSTAPMGTSSQQDDEDQAVRNFDVCKCLSSLFGCTVLPEANEGEPPAKQARMSPLRSPSTPEEPSCSNTTSAGGDATPTLHPPTQNHKHQQWNNRFLQKLQRELYSLQGCIPEVLLNRIRAIKILSNPSIEPIVYTTVRTLLNHRLDWNKLQKALSYLSVGDGESLGEVRAKYTAQLLMALCRKKLNQKKYVAISGAKLTRWCAAALMVQGLRIDPTVTPSLSHTLGFWHFISGGRDTAAAQRDLDKLLNSRYALSLLRHRRSINNTPPNSPPSSSGESDDTADEHED